MYARPGTGTSKQLVEHGFSVAQSYETIDRRRRTSSLRRKLNPLPDLVLGRPPWPLTAGLLVDPCVLYIRRQPTREPSLPAAAPHSSIGVSRPLQTKEFFDLHRSQLEIYIHILSTFVWFVSFLIRVWLWCEVEGQGHIAGVCRPILELVVRLPGVLTDRQTAGRTGNQL